MPSHSPFSKKIILVIGATGAQGLPVIDALLASSTDGSASPYAVRALTRDANSRRARELAVKGVEIVEGSFNDLDSVKAALKDVYGAWVNTDSFAHGEEHEMYLGMRIFELAKELKTVRHYVWSSIDFYYKKGAYNSKYRGEHFDSKGRVAEWMQAQPSIIGDDDMSWSVVTTTPYMDMLLSPMFGPLTRRANGTYVFAAPIGEGHVPMVALSDIGFFARYTFDHRELTSAKDLEITSDMVNWDYLVSTFEKVTGKKAVAVKQTVDEWMANFVNTDLPVAYEKQPGQGMTWKQNFTGWWNTFHDDVLTRDMQWLREVNPRGHTLESWMREVNYTGDKPTGALLKHVEDHNRIAPNSAHIAETLGKA